MRNKVFRQEESLDKMISVRSTKVDQLLGGEVDLPDVSGDFHLTINGVPLCLADRALAGSANSQCEFSSLNRSLADRLKLKETFPAAIIAVVPGKCQSHRSRRVA